MATPANLKRMLTAEEWNAASNPGNYQYNERLQRYVLGSQPGVANQAFGSTAARDQRDPRGPAARNDPRFPGQPAAGRPGYPDAAGSGYQGTGNPGNQGTGYQGNQGYQGSPGTGNPNDPRVANRLGVSNPGDTRFQNRLDASNPGYPGTSDPNDPRYAAGGLERDLMSEIAMSADRLEAINTRYPATVDRERHMAAVGDEVVFLRGLSKHPAKPMPLAPRMV